MDQTLDFDNELKLLRSRLKQREDKIETWLMEGTKQIVEAQTHKHAESLQKGLGTIYEPRCEKTGLRGFRPGPTQTGLYRHRRWLEA